MFVSCSFRFSIVLHYQWVSKLCRGTIWLRRLTVKKPFNIKFWEKPSAFSTNLKKSLPVCMDFALGRHLNGVSMEEICFPCELNICLQRGITFKSPNIQHVPTNPQLSFGFFYLTAMEFIKTSSWQYKVLSHALLKREKLKPITPEKAGKEITVASKPSGEPG